MRTPLSWTTSHAYCFGSRMTTSFTGRDVCLVRQEQEITILGKKTWWILSQANRGSYHQLSGRYLMDSVFQNRLKWLLSGHLGWKLSGLPSGLPFFPFNLWHPTKASRLGSAFKMLNGPYKRPTDQAHAGPLGSDMCSFGAFVST